MTRQEAKNLKVTDKVLSREDGLGERGEVTAIGESHVAIEWWSEDFSREYPLDFQPNEGLGIMGLR